MSNFTTGVPSSTQLKPTYGYLILLLIPVITIFGNSLMILAVAGDKKLRISVTNRYTAALAFADLLVGLIPMPLAVYVKVNRNQWDLGIAMCRFYVSCDVAGSTASILHLLLISGDRYLAVMWPHEYQRYAKRAKISFPIMLVWLISTTLTIPIVLGKSILNQNSCWLENPEYMVYSSLLSFYIPAGVLTLMYVKIFRKLNRHKGIRSMLRASGAICGGETGAPFHLPLVVVQEVSYAPSRPSEISYEKPSTFVTSDSTSSSPTKANDKENEDSHESAEFPADNEITAPSALVTAVEKICRSKTCPALGSEEKLLRNDAQFEENGVFKAIDDDGDNLLGGREMNTHGQKNKFESPSKSKQIAALTRFKRSISVVAQGIGRRHWISWSHGTSPAQNILYPHPYKNGDILSPEGPQSSRCRAHKRKSIKTPLISDDEREELFATSSRNLASRASGTWRKLTSRLTNVLQKKTDKRVVAKENKATKLVALILGVFIASWLPFFIFNFIRGICLSINDSVDSCDWLPTELFFLTTWLGYANSGFNPIIYGLVNEHFRATYKRILRLPSKNRHAVDCA